MWKNFSSTVMLIVLLTLKSLFAFDHTRIEGNIIDANGLAVVGVNVSLLPQGQGAVSDNDGHFIIEHMAPGKYTLKCEHIAYQTKLMKNITVENEQVIDVGAILMVQRVLTLSGVMITATRTDRNSYDLSLPINIISKNDIVERNAKTSAEALREEPGIFVQKTNHGGGSAIIRGLSSNQILLLVDGIRLNNSTYRLGNHQYLTTVDNNMVQQIDVVRGPGSMLYGSDALGGTINLITVRPSLQDETLDVDYKIFGRYSSADNERTTRSEIALRNPRFAWQAGISTKNYGDLKRGANSDQPQLEKSTNGLKQSPSGFNAYDFDSKFVFALTPQQHFILAYQLTAQVDVPRYDKYEDNSYYRWLYTPQNRNLIYLVYENNLRSRYISSLKTTVSFQRQEEGRETQQKVTSSLTKEKDKVDTFGLTLQCHTTLPKHLFTYGAEIYLDNVSSERFTIDHETGASQQDLQGRYPDGSVYNSLGVFLQDEYQLAARLHATAGIRYNYFTTTFEIPQPAEAAIQLGQIKQDFQSLTGSIGLLYRLTEQFSINTNLGQAFRAPNLSDITKLGESKGKIYEVPNPDLEPEKMLSLDCGVKLNFEKITATASAYYATITDLIASAAATYHGSATITKNGTTYNIKSKQNIGNAFIRGVEAALDYNFYRQFILHSNFSSTYGQNTTAAEPVGGIPPLFGMVGLKWKQENYYFDFYTRFAAKQNRLSADDKDDPRIPEGGTPGWLTYNVRAALELFNYGTLQLALENIFDYNYREHGSGINGPGRNFVISIELKR